MENYKNKKNSFQELESDRFEVDYFTVINLNVEQVGLEKNPRDDYSEALYDFYIDVRSVIHFECVRMLVAIEENPLENQVGKNLQMICQIEFTPLFDTMGLRLRTFLLMEDGEYFIEMVHWLIQNYLTDISKIMPGGPYVIPPPHYRGDMDKLIKELLNLDI